MVQATPGCRLRLVLHPLNVLRNISVVVSHPVQHSAVRPSRRAALLAEGHPSEAMRRQWRLIALTKMPRDVRVSRGGA